MQSLSEIIGEKSIGSAPVNTFGEFTATPCGLIPSVELEDACRRLGMIPDDTRSILGWKIAGDTLQDYEKYSEAISTNKPKRGADLSLLSDIGPQTTLRHQVESEVYRAYSKKYKNPKDTWEAYRDKRDVDLRRAVINRMKVDNQQAASSGKTEGEIKRERIKESLNKKFNSISL